MRIHIDSSTQSLAQSIVFSGGEVNVRLMDRLFKPSSVTIETQLNSSDKVMELLMATDAVRRHLAPKRLTLKMLYVPYARQDRVCNTGESLSIKVFCELINSLKFDEVCILSPHSDVTPALLNNVVDITGKFEHYAVDALTPEGDYVVVAPDGGALKRCIKFAGLAGKEVVSAEKVRDTMTGSITRTKVHTGDLTGSTAVIYDDLIDGGRTFIELAKILKREHGAEKVVLVVAHAIMSKGFHEISKYVDRMIVSDSFPYNKDAIENIEVTEIVM